MGMITHAAFSVVLVGWGMAALKPTAAFSYALRLTFAPGRALKFNKAIILLLPFLT